MASSALRGVRVLDWCDYSVKTKYYGWYQRTYRNPSPAVRVSRLPSKSMIQRYATHWSGPGARCPRFRLHTTEPPQRDRARGCSCSLNSPYTRTLVWPAHRHSPLSSRARSRPRVAESTPTAPAPRVARRLLRSVFIPRRPRAARDVSRSLNTSPKLLQNVLCDVILVRRNFCHCAYSGHPLPAC